MMMLLCIKQHLSNIWSSIDEKVKQYWGLVEKKRCLYEKACIVLPNMSYFWWVFRKQVNRKIKGFTIREKQKK